MCFYEALSTYLNLHILLCNLQIFPSKLSIQQLGIWFMNMLRPPHGINLAAFCMHLEYCTQIILNLVIRANDSSKSAPTRTYLLNIWSFRLFIHRPIGDVLIFPDSHDFNDIYCIVYQQCTDASDFPLSNLFRPSLHLTSQLSAILFQPGLQSLQKKSGYPGLTKSSACSSSTYSCSCFCSTSLQFLIYFPSVISALLLSEVCKPLVSGSQFTHFGCGILPPAKQDGSECSKSLSLLIYGFCLFFLFLFLIICICSDVSKFPLSNIFRPSLTLIS